MPLVQYLKNLSNNKEIYLKIKVSPGAAKSCLLGLLADGTLKIALAAVADKGRANRELIRFLRASWSPEPDQVRLITGRNQRQKLVKIKF